MIYRNLKEEEIQDLRKLQSIVYFMKYDKDEPSKEPEYDKIRWKGFRGAFTEEGKLAAVLEIIPFKSYLDGTVVGSGGIAGVATLLEYRRGGTVKTLLKNAYEEMFENGDVMSYLYPFSHEYYEKYGYSQAGCMNQIKVDLDQLQWVDHDGITKQYFVKDGYEDIKAVYDKFSQNYNCCVARENWRWKRLFSSDPYTSNELVYIRYNKDNKPVAYLKVIPKEVAMYTYDMHVPEAAWTGNDGLKGLMSIINGYKGDLKKLILEVPSEFPIELFVKEFWKLDVSKKYIGMNRIINAKKALEIIKKPENPGKAIIEITDEQAPWNTGNWLVEWDKSGSSVSKTNTEPDLRCKIPSFSQLVTGYMPFEKMCLKKDIESIKNDETLRSLFIQKPCFIWDRF